MGQTLTYTIELAVGLACLGAAITALRRRGLRAVGVGLLLAGALAASHASARLLW